MLISKTTGSRLKPCRDDGFSNGSEKEIPSYLMAQHLAAMMRADGSGHASGASYLLHYWQVFVNDFVDKYLLKKQQGSDKVIINKPLLAVQ
ncbi:MAG: hypothetical protein F4W91_05395 [Gemmatimonadetes bacterium]|nr:hypothetical protein [Gemmatimonadota bacterium]